MFWDLALVFVLIFLIKTKWKNHQQLKKLNQLEVENEYLRELIDEWEEAQRQRDNCQSAEARAIDAIFVKKELERLLNPPPED